MPPNLDSPSGTLDNNSSNAPIHLDQLEQTLRRLQRDTLKIKKRNETVLDTLRRDKNSGRTFDLLGQESTENGATGGPSKPLRTSKFLPEVTEILRQSEEMKRIMKEEQRKNEEHLRKMKNDGEKLTNSLKKVSELNETKNCVSSVPSDGLQSYKATFSLMNGVRSTLNKALDRLNYGSGMPKGEKAVLLSHCETTEVIRNAGHDQQSNESVNDFSQGIENSKTSTPIAKTRMILKPTTTIPERSVPAASDQVIKKPTRPRAPPPPVPLLEQQITIEALKELYQNLSDAEESRTLSLKKPPVPKPRPDKQQQKVDEESEVSGMDESSSEFDFVVAPLKVEMVEVSTTDESDESMKKVRRKGFQKNPQLKKNKKLKEIINSGCTGYKITKKTCTTPPLVIVENLDPTVPASAATRTSSPIPSQSTVETLVVPEIQRLETPPPVPAENIFIDTSLEEETIPDKLSVITTTLTSALIPGRRICPVDIKIEPWKSNGKKYTIYAASKTFVVFTLTKRNLPEEQYCQRDYVEVSAEDKSVAVDTISESFSFLDNTAEVNDEVPDFPLKNSEIEIPLKEDGCSNLEEVCRLLVDTEEIEETIETTELGKMTSYYFDSKTDETETTCEEVKAENCQMEMEEKASTHTHDDDRVDEESPVPPLPMSKPPSLEEYNKPVILEIIALPTPTDEITEVVETTGPPPPPPAMPEVPLFTSSIGKNHRVLPVTPIDDSHLRDSIFFTLSFDVEGDNEKLHSELKMIEGQFNKSATEGENCSDTLEILNASTQSSKSSSVSLLSQRRRNAVAICAKRLNHLSADRIMSGLKELDVKMFTADDIQILMQIMPKDDEKSILETLDGSRTTSLCEEDHFLQQLSQIPRCAQKLDVISFTLGFDETIRSLEADIEILESATDSIKLSPKFPKILEVILMIVNQAFVKSDGQKVKAFDIHSLTKLASKKSVDGKGTLLNFIVKFVETNFSHALTFHEDFRHIDEAARISQKDCVDLLKETEKGLQSVRDEIDAIANETFDRSDGVSYVIGFIIEATEALERISRRWEQAIKQLKELMTYLALSTTDECNIKEFFGLISKFTSDFKHAVAQNERLFPTIKMRNSTNNSSTDSSLALRRVNRLSLGPGDIALRNSEESFAARRKTLGNFSSSSTSALLQMQEETGQPSEFIDALIVFGQKSTTNSNDSAGESEKSKIRRRASLYTPYPFRKRNSDTNPTRERI